MKDSQQLTANVGKFIDPRTTADGQVRATVPLSNAETLWFNTGTLCNITCENCYILSSPKNDALVYLTVAEVEDYLNQLEVRKWNVREIAFTGGEPFMNPDMLAMTEASLKRGYEVLILTNAMQPMQRKRVSEGLVALNEAYPGKITLRISLDHWDMEAHDAERGKGAFNRSLIGMDFLRDNDIQMAVAGRALWHESDAAARAGYAAIFEAHGYNIDAQNPGQCVLFPEMDMAAEVPEITESCWGILNKTPDSVMCASSRMVVKRKGADKPAVLSCTLLPYDEQFEMGHTLEEAEADVALNHPHCAKFCVLGGASCSA
ncbi:radical SAM protein [Thalassobius sp. Cn5-15]|uniref:radical SAM protein n=1 Tax=Thalassobius sp. Cn5-15 TaxID=2917763 RepID=UPI001EF24AB6|nr:radical SAM protein [Thalassobius sp. Cn5-15]MCG7492329.1 radical SAM protein [Thalassobius sp. Cn5-15]